MNYLHPQTQFCNQNNRSNHSVQTAIRAELIDSDRCSALGLTARGTTPAFALCRLLIEAGHDPATPLEAWRGTTLCLRVRSIGEGAHLTVEDDRRGRPRLRRWRNRGQGRGAAPPVRQIGDGDASCAIAHACNR
jgi:hypothetical protein